MVKIKKGEVLELEITSMAYGGRGIAKIEGFAVFVDGALPGDLVKARIRRKKKNFAEAFSLEILKASPDRIPPSCSYSGYCGGCRWQALSYEKQLEYKKNHVEESLSHIGGLNHVPVLSTLPSERVFGYRNKMEFSFSDRRWLLPHELEDPEAEKGFGLGLHVPGTFSKVLDIETCLIQPDEGNRILGTIRDFVAKNHLPVYGLKSHEGFWRFVMLRHSVYHNQWMVNLVTAYEEQDTLMSLARIIRKNHPDVVSVVNNIHSGKAGIAVGEKEIPLYGDPFIVERIGEYTFQISANSFFQTNSRGAETLYGVVKQMAGLGGSENVLDLYCGAGTISLYLSRDAQAVHGVELVESAVKDANLNRSRNLDKKGAENCRFIQKEIKGNILDGVMDEPPDLVVVDPPRAGMHKDAADALLKMASPKIVFVSCNPATMARDLSLLAQVYDIENVQPVDMFPHTFHIESVALLTRKP